MIFLDTFCFESQKKKKKKKKEAVFRDYPRFPFFYSVSVIFLCFPYSNIGLQDSFVADG